MRKGLLEALPFGVGVVSGEWWESLSACSIHPESCHVVPDYTPALYRTKEPIYLRGAACPPPYISLATPVFLHAVPTHDLESDESLRNLGLQVVGGVGQSKAFEDWYHILTNSRLGSKPDVIWDLLSNTHSCEECWADPNHQDGGGLGPASLPLCWEWTPLKQAGEQCSARWPAMRDLFPT